MGQKRLHGTTKISKFQKPIGHKATKHMMTTKQSVVHTSNLKYLQVETQKKKKSEISLLIGNIQMNS